jgi:hypothetical protein
MKPLAIAFILAGLHVASGAANAGGMTRSLLPPPVPAADEQPILGVPALNFYKRLEQCFNEAKANLNDMAGSPVSVGSAHFALNRRWGYLLRADFTRDDVAPPSINRIVCWGDGQIIAAKLAIPPLESVERSHLLALPGIRKP